MAYIKPLQFSSPVKDGSCSGFVFSEEWCQTAFLQFGYHLRVVQWGETPWLRVSIRARYIPVGTRFCLQSLVCYTGRCRQKNQIVFLPVHRLWHINVLLCTRMQRRRFFIFLDQLQFHSTENTGIHQASRQLVQSFSKRPRRGLRAYAVPFYDTFWNIHGMKEYERIYSKPFSEERKIRNITIKDEQNELQKIVKEMFSRASYHFGDPLLKWRWMNLYKKSVLSWVRF